MNEPVPLLALIVFFAFIMVAAYLAYFEDREAQARSFPAQDVELVRIYRCGQCELMFLAQTGPVISVCGVDHGPGSCCHFNELRVSQGHLEAVMGVLARAFGVPERGWHRHRPRRLL